MKILTSCILFFTSCIVAGCKRDEGLQPPPESEKVLIEVKLPAELKVLPLGVMYRSNICHKKRMNAYGISYDEPGYNFIEMRLKRNSDTYNYYSLVPSDGGGQCDWKLSNITIDVEYNKEKFSGKINDVVGTGVVLVFDDNHPQVYDGIYKDVSGDLFISLHYFPWVHESFLSGPARKLWTYGEKINVNYRTKNTHKVVFSPISHSKLITYSTGPKVKKPGGGNYTRYIYPDGSVVENGGPFPDFKKLEAIANEKSKNR